MDAHIVILGSGESGMGAARLAVKQGLSVFLSDQGKIAASKKSLLQLWGVAYEEGGHQESNVLKATSIVKSPGIPEEAPIVVAARERQIPVISEIEFAFQFIPESSHIIAITGTNGKTTTTLLTHHLLKAAGLDVALTGNVGYSLAGSVAERIHDYYVVEVSSFQLDGIIAFKPDIAVLLNITPDHLDR
jgi:UDP-N-acetylmuramoylalanine-D-glutamate ligase